MGDRASGRTGPIMVAGRKTRRDRADPAKQLVGEPSFLPYHDGPCARPQVRSPTRPVAHSPSICYLVRTAKRSPVSSPESQASSGSTPTVWVPVLLPLLFRMMA
jgi:hypothetical protein